MAIQPRCDVTTHTKNRLLVAGRSIAMLVLLVWSLFCPDAQPAEPRPATQDPESQAAERRQLPTNSRVDQTLRSLRDAVQDGNGSAAIEFLGRLVTAERSTLAARPGHSQFVPMHRLLAEEFADLPADSQKNWRRTTGPSARIALRDVLQTREWSSLIEVIHRYPGTDSAHLARLMLAQLHLDRRHHTAARYWLQTVAPSQITSRLRDIHQQLQARLNSADSEAQSSRPVSQPVDAADRPSWKVQWDRKAQVGAALRREIEMAGHQAVGLTDTAWQAEVRQGVVFRRTLQGLSAIDLDSGQPRWALRLRPSHLEQLTRTTDQSRSGRTMVRHLSDLARQLLTHDGVVGGISSGDDAIYTVTARSAPGGIAGLRLSGSVHDADPRLSAWSVRDGRRLWSAGGPALEDASADLLADAWFAGPPLVTKNDLHCLIQQGSEIRLVSLKASSGEAIDSVLLAFADYAVRQDPARRLVASAPVAAGGLILCATTTGWVVAVDELTRSVLWATRTASPSRKDERALRMARRVAGSPFSREQSPRTTVRLAGETAVVIPWNAPEIHWIDIVSGERQHQVRMPERPGVLAMLNDRALISVDRGRRIRCLEGASGKRLWEHELAAADGVPCGPGVLSGGQVLMAMTSGSIIAVDPDVGRVTESTSDVLPPFQHGALLSASGENAGTADADHDLLLFVGPAETVCLTRRAQEATPTATRDRVRLQLAAGRNTAAWETLSELPESVFTNDTDAASLRFETAFRLAVVDMLPDSVSLEELAVSPVQRIQAIAVRLVGLFDDEPQAAAAEALGILLNDQPSGLEDIADAVAIPVRLLPPQPEAANVTPPEYSDDQPIVSVRTWAAQILETALHRLPAAEDSSWTDRLTELSSETLLQIQHPAVAPAVRNRLSEESGREMTIHLLRHLHETEPDVAVPRLYELPAWLESADRESDRAQLHREYLESLLRHAKVPGVSESVDDVPPADVSVLDEKRRAWWNSWQPEDYVTLPFGRPGPAQRRPYRLRMVDPNEAFLRHLDPQIHRSPSRLLIHEAGADGRLLWSIPGRFPVRRGPAELPALVRAGSLLLIEAAEGVSAVSVADQRVLWYSRRTAVVQTGTESSVPSARFSTRLVSASPRWICLQTSASIEMLDALTGHTMWSCPVVSPAAVFAGSRCVVVLSHDSGQVTAWDRTSGRPIPCGFTADDVRRIVSSQGDDFVLQQPVSDDGQQVQLVWKNALTGDASKTIRVTDVLRVEQDSGRTVFWKADGGVSVVDLQSGASREYRWPDRSGDSSVDGSQSAAGDQAAAEWQYFEDPDFVYLIERNDEPRPRSHIPDRRLTPWRRLRTLDRESGQLLWELSLPPARHGTVVTDQLNLPFVVLIDQEVPDAPAKQNSSVQIRCLAKQDGRTLIAARLPSRYSYDELRISAEDDFAVSVELHGTHVRFERADRLSVHRPGLPAE